MSATEAVSPPPAPAPAPAATSKAISFGVLMINYQALDCVGPLDLLSTCSYDTISQFAPPLAAGSIPLTIHHIGIDLSPVHLSAGFRAIPTTTTADCPELDFLLVGGPDPTRFKLDPRFAEFVKEHVKRGRGLFTTCTGAFAIAETGVLDGRTATVNHEFLDQMRQQRPQVNWVREQWVEDGNIWTAGGAYAGMDMFAHWIRTNYGREAVAAGFQLLDFVGRDQKGKRIEA